PATACATGARRAPPAGGSRAPSRSDVRSATARWSTRARRSAGASAASAPASRLSSDPVAEAAHRLDQRDSELAPQPRDEDLDRVGVTLEVLCIDVLGQLALRDDAPAVVHQIRQ